jgi:hypothetical protein
MDDHHPLGCPSTGERRGVRATARAAGLEGVEMSKGTLVPRNAGIAVAVSTVLAGLVAAPPVGAAFPGDNGRIAFHSGRDGHPEIYSMNPDGTDQIRLTNNASGNFQPSYSADGRKIAFWSRRDGNAEIYTMDPDGTNQTRITNNPAADRAPSFAADGRIVFTRDFGDTAAIYVMNADGTNQTRVASTPTDPPANDPWPRPNADDAPTFSPDGTKIAFQQILEPTRQSDIWRMDSGGTNPTNLTKSPIGATNGHANFSPDGETLVFETHRGRGFEIYTMGAEDGGNQTSVGYFSNRFPQRAPVFSPDGTRIAFHGGTGSPDIHVMNPDDGRWIPRTSGPGGNIFPSWGPRPVAGARADVLHGGASGEVICGRGGPDVIRGLGGNDTLFGDRCGVRGGVARASSAAAASGDDRLHGGAGRDRLYGHAGRDRLNGGSGPDTLHGGAGGDRFSARDGDRDRVLCGAGLDVVRADRADRLSGCERAAISRSAR